MLKHLREALKVIRSRYPEVVIEHVRQHKHFIFNVRLPDGRERTVACAGSPRDPEIAARRAILEFEKAINAPKEKRLPARTLHGHGLHVQGGARRTK